MSSRMGLDKSHHGLPRLQLHHLIAPNSRISRQDGTNHGRGSACESGDCQAGEGHEERHEPEGEYELEAESADFAGRLDAQNVEEDHEDDDEADEGAHGSEGRTRDGPPPPPAGHSWNARG